ncbi:hypothetical protein Q8A73_000700 [Channa argus]|nr:hypothetical protein Q8A73_000700 [Channa argus]
MCISPWLFHHAHPNPFLCMSSHCSPSLLHSIPFSPLHLPLHGHSTPLSCSPQPCSPLSSPTPLSPFSFHPPLPFPLIAVVSEGQMTGELAPGRALSHPGAIRLVANNRCFRPGEDQSGGIMGNVRSSAFYTSAQMDEITLGESELTEVKGVYAWQCMRAIQRIN